MNNGLQLDHIVLLGRSLAEYSQFFDLQHLRPDADRLLDMGAGVSSLCAELSEQGHHVTAADPIYDLSSDIIAAKCRRDIEDVCTQLPELAHHYRWEYYRDISDLKQHREKACQSFLQHFRMNPRQYVTAELPGTPFQVNEFTVTFVSHCLFLYDDRLNYEFHKRSILELARITSREIQIYPLTNFNGKPSSFVDRIQQDQDLSALDFHIEQIDFEFVKNANERMRITNLP